MGAELVTVSYHSLVGHVIRSKRKELGFSLAAVACEMDVGCSGWSKIEKGIVPANMIKLCLFSVIVLEDPNEVLKSADALVELCLSHGVNVTIDTVPLKSESRKKFLFGDSLLGFLDGLLINNL